MRGGRRGGLWSEEEIASSGTGSERAHGRERSRGDPSASQEPREPSLAAGRTTALPGTGDPRRCGGFLGLGGDTPERWGGDNPQLSTRYRNVPPWNVPGELGRAEPAASGRRSR